MKKLISIIVGGSIIAIAIFVNNVAADSEEPIELQDCVADQEQLDMKFKEYKVGPITGHYPTERHCMSKSEYKALKKALKDDYEEGKDYDFDINNRNILNAVLNKEIVDQGGIALEGDVSKEDLQEALINLLE